VVVSFQENAWVDARTNVYGLEKTMKPIDEWLASEGFDRVQFEDNLSAHKTDAVAEYWKENLKNFLDPRYYPAQLTLLLQAIDHHIGIIYKISVTKAVQAFLVEKLEQAKRDGVEFDPASAMFISEKRILITKVVADTHERLAKANVFKRAFIATGTYMPIEHLLAADGGQNSPVDKEVLLQGMEKEYVYAEQCPRSEIFAFKLKADREAVEAAVEKARLEAEEVEKAERVASRLQVYASAGEILLPAIKEELQQVCCSVIDSLVPHIDGKFVIGGLFPAMKLLEVISRAVSSVEDRDDCDVPPSFFDKSFPNLIANDIDVYHG
jgi:hypothetical protein